MESLRKEKHVSPWLTVPTVLVTALAIPFGLYTAHLCACLHPVAVMVGKTRPLDLTDDVIRQRLSEKLPVGSLRGKAEEFFRKYSPERAADKYCKGVSSRDGIACEYLLEQDLFRWRQRGLIFNISFNDAGEVRAIDVSRFTRYAWD